VIRELISTQQIDKNTLRKELTKLHQYLNHLIVKIAVKKTKIKTKMELTLSLLIAQKEISKTI